MTKAISVREESPTKYKIRYQNTNSNMKIKLFVPGTKDGFKHKMQNNQFTDLFASSVLQYSTSQCGTLVQVFISVLIINVDKISSSLVLIYHSPCLASIQV